MAYRSREGWELRKQSACFFALVFMLPGYAVAQSEAPPPMPLEQQEQMEQLDKLRGLATNLQASLEAATADKKNQCMKAFGNMEFCNCIAEKSPVGVDFIGYVRIAAGTKEDFKYEQLSSDDKELFDNTRRSRDECVNWKGKGDEIKPAN